MQRWPKDASVLQNPWVKPNDIDAAWIGSTTAEDGWKGIWFYAEKGHGASRVPSVCFSRSQPVPAWQALHTTGSLKAGQQPQTQQNFPSNNYCQCLLAPRCNSRRQLHRIRAPYMCTCHKPNPHACNGTACCCTLTQHSQPPCLAATCVHAHTSVQYKVASTCRVAHSHEEGVTRTDSTHI